MKKDESKYTCIKDKTCVYPHPTNNIEHCTVKIDMMYVYVCMYELRALTALVNIPIIIPFHVLSKLIAQYIAALAPNERMKGLVNDDDKSHCGRFIRIITPLKSMPPSCCFHRQSNVEVTNNHIQVDAITSNLMEACVYT